MERLQKVIATSGYCSRRKAEELIKSGKVFVDGEMVTEMGLKVTGDVAITIDGKPISFREQKVYYLLNKPRGVISSSSDEKGRKTVIDLINTKYRVYPIGRLDYDTTGLIILTNDGDLSNILMHPNSGVEKKYIAKLNRCFEINDLKKLENGIIIDNKKCIPTRVKLKNNDRVKDTSIVEISIVEGRNHIIKNVFKELGYFVDKLSRVEYGFLNLDGLRSGEARELSNKEVKKLYEYRK